MLVEVLPWLRGKVSAEKRQIATVEMRDEVLEFVNSNDAPRLAELGTSCPDHFLRTKIKPLYADWNPAGGDVASLKKVLEAGLTQYRADYAEYYEQCKRPDSPAIRVSSPSVILIPGVGLVAWGKSKSESRVTAEFYNAAIGVMRGAERVSQYIALDRQEAFDIEYWLLEEAKLKRMPAEKPLDRQVVVVVGAGSGIGRGLLARLVGEGASVVAVDRDADGASRRRERAAEESRDGHRRRRHGDLRRGAGDRTGRGHDGPRGDPARARARRSSRTAAWTRWSSPPATTRIPTRRARWAITSGRARSRST